MSKTLIGIVMGSESDYETMKHAEDVLQDFSVPYEIQIVSAHRTPELMYQYAQQAASRGLEILIAGAGGAAHLPGMLASLSALPVLGVPVESKSLKGMDSLLSIVQMPGGIPTATFAIGTAGATNAALFAIRILALKEKSLLTSLSNYKEDLAKKALSGNAQVQRLLNEASLSLPKQIHKNK